MPRSGRPTCGNPCTISSTVLGAPPMRCRPMRPALVRAEAKRRSPAAGRVWAFWRPRLERIARWFIEQERRRREAAHTAIRTEPRAP